MRLSLVSSTDIVSSLQATPVANKSMAPVTNGASRAASAQTSRAGSIARDIMKKRSKPYKTEQQLVRTKKPKKIYFEVCCAPLETHGCR